MSRLNRLNLGPAKPDVAMDFQWVDEFITNVRPYIFVRVEDCLLIKRPNQAQKLNPVGARLLKSLLDGESIQTIIKPLRQDAAKLNDVANFLRAVKTQLEGGIDEFTTNPAVQVQPFEMKFSRYPVLSEVAITYRCNLRCSFCYAGCNCTANPTGSGQEMTPAQIKLVLEKIRHQALVPSVSFTGGEPTLVQELPELIRYAKSLDMRVNLITNGTRVSAAYARQLAAAGLDSAQVSLEGVTAATNDQIVQIPGAYQKTCAAVNHLKSAGIHTHTNTTLTKQNVHEAVDFPGFVRDEFGNDRFSMNLIIPTGSGALNNNLIIPYSDIGSFLEKIIAASDQAGVEFMWYSPVPMCMFNSVVHGLGNKGCSACDGLISIAANGDVLPCASYDDPVGNLLATDFDPIWQSARAMRYRDKKLAHSQCQQCDRFHICNGACPLYWRHMGFGELVSVMGFNSEDFIPMSAIGDFVDSAQIEQNP